MPESGERRKDMIELEKKIAEVVLSVAVMGTDVGYIKAKIDNITMLVEQKYVTRTEFDAKFDPVRKLVFGMVGLVLIAVVTAMIALVVKR